MSDFVRTVAVSDTHHNRRALKEIVRCYSDMKYLFHLGDNTADARYLADHMPSTHVISVRGNCDWGEDEPEWELITIQRQRIVLTHGHLFHVKFSYDRLEQFGQEKSAAAVLFGHTHVPYVKRQGGLWLINPGSAGEPRGGEPTVAVILIGQAGLVPKLIRLQNC